MLKIEKNKPIPEQGTKYPYPSMRVGDSFLVPHDKRNAAITSAKYRGLTVITRKEGDQVRVWVTGKVKARAALEATK